MSQKNKLIDKEKNIASPQRRKLLKKAAYTVPTLMVLGVIMPTAKAYAYSEGDPPEFPSPPFPGGQNMPLRRK